MLKSAKDLILRLRAEDDSSKGLAAAVEEVTLFLRQCFQSVKLKTCNP